MRLLPLAILIIGAIVGIKIFSFVFEQPLLTGSSTPVQAEEKPKTADGADEKAAEQNKDTELDDGKAEKQKIDQIISEQEEKGLKDAFSDTEIQLLLSLKKRRDLLDKRERKIDLQTRLLEAAEQQLDNKIAELKTLEQTLKQKLGEVNTEEVERFSSLVKTYETMKPKEAAGLMSVLDLTIMENIARSMSTKKLAPILAKMNLKAARALTIRLAQPPRELKIEDVPTSKVKKPSESLPTLELQ